MKGQSRMPDPGLSKADLEARAGSGCRLRRVLRFTEAMGRRSTATPMQCRLLHEVRVRPVREGSTVPELAERRRPVFHGFVAPVARFEAADSGRGDPPLRARLRRRQATLAASRSMPVVWFYGTSSKPSGRRVNGLEGNLAIVTAAASGIGKALAASRFRLG